MNLICYALQMCFSHIVRLKQHINQIIYYLEIYVKRTQNLSFIFLKSHFLINFFAFKGEKFIFQTVQDTNKYKSLKAYF